MRLWICCVYLELRSSDLKISLFYVCNYLNMTVEIILLYYIACEMICELCHAYSLSLSLVWIGELYLSL